MSADSSIAASLAAHTRWAAEADRAAATRPMRDGFRAKLLREARERLGPEASEEQVQAAAENARQAHYASMRLKSLQSRRARRPAAPVAVDEAATKTGASPVATPQRHPVAQLGIEVACEQGWDVRYSSEAAVAIQLGLLGYTPRDVETQFNLGPYRLDFAIPAERIAIEADGWVHGAPRTRARDAARDRAIRGWGWIVARIDTEGGDVAAQLRRHVPDRRRIAVYGDALRRMDCQFKAYLDRLQRWGVTDPETALESLSAAFRVAQKVISPGNPRVGP